MPGFFNTRDNIPLEIEYHPAENPRTCLVVWPCMAGSYRMYRTPVKSFTDKNISVLLYNPRAHGESGGQLTRTSSPDDLEYILEENGLTTVPLLIAAHSAGANAALKFAVLKQHIAHLYLVAPVLDSCESLEHMYDCGTINEFNLRVAEFALEKEFVLTVLHDRRWMDKDYWHSENLKRRLNDISGRFLIGSFLEELFIPTHNAFGELAACRNKSTILLATDDHWYPRRRINELSDKHGISSRIIPEAGDHFFTGAWKTVWQIVLEES